MDEMNQYLTALPKTSLSVLWLLERMSTGGQVSVVDYDALRQQLELNVTPILPSKSFRRARSIEGCLYVCCK